MQDSENSIGFIPWVLSSITPEISSNLLTVKVSSGIMAMD